MDLFDFFMILNPLMDMVDDIERVYSKFVQEIVAFFIVAFQNGLAVIV
jgi:hypothetical protein